MITFTVRPDDGEPYEVTADSRDLYVWERTSKRDAPSFLELMTQMRMEHLYPIAWIASKRAGRYTGKLDTFAKECALEFTEDDDPDPTQPAP